MEEKELSRNNKIKIIVVTLLTFFVAIAGISYAYFSIQITGNDTASSIRVTTANLRLIYTDTLVMSGDKISPSWTQTKTITVENAGNQPVYYNIIWRDLYNEIINDELVISATCTSDVSGNSCEGISETVIPTELTETHNIAIKNNIGIQVGETHTYTVTVTFKETGSNQNYNQNKEFYGTLNISEGSAPATLSLQTDTGTTGLSTGDVVRASKNGMANQDFYVVSTDASETVLLSQYNLYVGRIYNTSNSTYTEIQSSASGYGLQSSTAKGYVSGSNVQYIGVVPFSGSSSDYGYWYDSTNSTIYSKYGTYTNSANNIYDTDYTTAPNWNYNFCHDANNANYSVAYYVEEYVGTLGINGAGRLLTYEEEQTLASSNNSIVFNGTTYWLGSANVDYSVWYVDSGGYVYGDYFDRGYFSGVRPVIVVSTSDISS